VAKSNRGSLQLKEGLWDTSTSLAIPLCRGPGTTAQSSLPIAAATRYTGMGFATCGCA